MSDQVARASLADLAIEHQKAGRLPEAEAAIDRILAREPALPGGLHFKGQLAFQRGDLEGAARFMERAIVMGSTAAHSFSDLTEVYRLLGRLDEALTVGRIGAKAHPEHAVTHANLSVVHYARCESPDAVAEAERAIALDPQLATAHLGLAEALLIDGHFERGWEEYEWRYRRVGIENLIPRTDIPAWDGRKVKGALLLIEEQGFGDAIQFSRYVPWAAKRCERLVVGRKPEAGPFFESFPEIDVTFERWEDCPPVEAWAPLSGLPRLHGTRAGNIPAKVPYYRADPKLVAEWKARLEGLDPRGLMRIGLAFAGKPTHVNDHNRSMGLSTLAPLAGIEGVAFVSLQKGPAQAQVAAWPGPARLIDLGPSLGDFRDTMAVLESLDLMVTVDTSLSHLSGALGRPVFIMLPFAPDWRWLKGRSDSPWYPSARLFRQARPRDWDPVVAEVRRAIEELRSRPRQAAPGPAPAIPAAKSAAARGRSG